MTKEGIFLTYYDEDFRSNNKLQHIVPPIPPIPPTPDPPEPLPDPGDNRMVKQPGWSCIRGFTPKISTVEYEYGDFMLYIDVGVDYDVPNTAEGRKSLATIYSYENGNPIDFTNMVRTTKPSNSIMVPDCKNYYTLSVKVTNNAFYVSYIGETVLYFRPRGTANKTIFNLYSQKINTDTGWLKSIDLSHVYTDAAIAGNAYIYAFRDSEYLEYAVAHKNACQELAFAESNMRVLVLPEGTEGIGATPDHADRTTVQHGPCNTIICYAKTPPTQKSNTVFGGCGNIAIWADLRYLKIYVPAESVETYKEHAHWSYLKDYIYPITQEIIDTYGKY